MLGKRLTYPVFTDVCSALCHTEKLSRCSALLKDSVLDADSFATLWHLHLWQLLKTLSRDQKSSVLPGWSSSGWPVPCLMGSSTSSMACTCPWPDWGFKLVSADAYCVLHITPVTYIFTCVLCVTYCILRVCNLTEYWNLCLIIRIAPCLLNVIRLRQNIHTSFSHDV